MTVVLSPMEPLEGPGNVGDVPGSLVYPLEFVALGAILQASHLSNSNALIKIASLGALVLLASIGTFVLKTRLRTLVPLRHARATWIQSALFVFAFFLIVSNSL